MPLLARLTGSDPAEQPAPAAPEGGAPGGGPPGGPPGPSPNLSSNRRLQQTQAQVEEVVDIIRVNVDKVLERDQKLAELDDRADALQAGASQFESSAAKLKRKYWWKNCKMMIMMGVICAIVVVVIAKNNSPLVLGHVFVIQVTAKSRMLFTAYLGA
ncbi:vesicle-associated membrane protein 1 [Egretta garzetta]|uniref:vesicle-associated membrane protein 1 n=1 Tax=Egretta garzetta TaxID=188379 RepID=UPI00163D0496|nr:vesicle-associated membrane protein 1 [Egretta garzetta]